ncbi:MAG: potassium-transporting ATPase subunit KdpC [Ruthenibacterium sp.]
MKILNELKKPLLVTLVLMVLCGLIYPLLLTGIGQLLFPRQANGSLITVNGKAVGSAIVGQEFTDSRFLRGRPSAIRYNTYTAADAVDGTYAGVGSGSANYGPSNPALAQRVQADMDAFLAQHPDLTPADLPADLMTASGSGLDPDVSPAAAAVQLVQLAKNTGLSEEMLAQFVAENTKGKFLGVFGEARVNVLGVNLAIAQELCLLPR